MKVLHLTLKKKWFDMIASGEKKEEYREVTEWSVPRMMQMDWALELERFGIEYKKLRSAFAYCWGFRRNKVDGALFLLDVCCSYRKYDSICLINGYQKNARRMTLQFVDIEIREGRSEWGAEPGKKYFVIKLGERLDSPNLAIGL